MFKAKRYFQHKSFLTVFLFLMGVNFVPQDRRCRDKADGLRASANL
jgi:hypothetical protein